MKNWLMPNWGLVSPRICRVSQQPETQENRCYNSSPNADRLEIWEELAFQFESKGRKQLMSQFQGVKQEEFSPTQGRVSSLFYSGFQLFRWGPTHNTKAIYFMQSTDLNVNLIQKHPHKHAECLIDYLGIPWSTLVAQSCPTPFATLRTTAPPGSVHGIHQARLEWVTIPSPVK